MNIGLPLFVAVACVSAVSISHAHTPQALLKSPNNPNIKDFDVTFSGSLAEWRFRNTDGYYPVNIQLVNGNSFTVYADVKLETRVNSYDVTRMAQTVLNNLNLPQSTVFKLLVYSSELRQFGSSNIFRIKMD